MSTIPPDNRVIGQQGHVQDHNSISDSLTSLSTGLATEVTRAQAAEALLMPKPSGTAQAGNVPVATGAGSASAWGQAGIVPPAGDIGGTPSAPTVVQTHLAAPLPVVQGGTGTASAQPNNVYAGPASGGAAAPAFRALTAADIPQLAQYNPIGLTGTTAPTSYAGGTVSGHPLSGTWSQGQFVVDQTGKIYVCVAGGTPGTWRRVGAMPYQFFLDDYVKGDGKQALVTVATGSNVINATPLAAPPAPVPTQATTGGTIAAGVYGAIITFVNRWGETVGSAAGTVTTTTGTSTITIPAPAPIGNATGWYCYLTQANGAVYTRQQAAGSPSALEVPLTLTAPPTSNGANPPASDSSAAQIFTSTAVDGGKNAMICGGLGSPGGPWVGTIVTVNSPTQAVVSDTTIAVSQAGCAMVFASDERLIVDQCASDAHAYAVVNNNFAQIIGSDKNIGLGANLFQSLNTTATYQYNTQMRLMPNAPSGQTEKLEIQLLGPGDNDHCEFWVSQLPNLAGMTFISFSVGPAAANPTFGQQSVISGPQGGVNFNGSNAFANLKAVIKGVRVVQPGWSNTIGIDLQWVAGFTLRASSVAYAPSTGTGGGVNPSNAWTNNTFWQAKIDAALRTPNEGNNDDCIIESFTSEGLVQAIVGGVDHLVIQRLATINGYFGIRITGGDQNTHDLTIHQWSFENMTGGILQNNSSGHVKVHIVMDGENTGPVYDIQDNGNNLYGTVWWSDPFRAAGGPANIIAPIIQGCANLEIINGHVARQVFGAPAYTLGTALQNPWFRHMWVTLSGGTTTNILIGPTSALCTTSVGATTPVTFRLPSGWWVNIQGSVKPTTFNAIPD